VSIGLFIQGRFLLGIALIVHFCPDVYVLDGGDWLVVFRIVWIRVFYVFEVLESFEVMYFSVWSCLEFRH